MLLQFIDLTASAEELGADGACHFAYQLSALFPMLAAVASRTSRIEICTGVINMRDENPLKAVEKDVSLNSGTVIAWRMLRR